MTAKGLPILLNQKGLRHESVSFNISYLVCRCIFHLNNCNMASESMGPAYIRKEDNRVNGKLLKKGQSLFTIDLSLGRIICNECGAVSKIEKRLTKENYKDVENFKEEHRVFSKHWARKV